MQESIRVAVKPRICIVWQRSAVAVALCPYERALDSALWTAQSSVTPDALVCRRRSLRRDRHGGEWVLWVRSAAFLCSCTSSTEVLDLAPGNSVISSSSILSFTTRMFADHHTACCFLRERHDILSRRITTAAGVIACFVTQFRSDNVSQAAVAQCPRTRCPAHRGATVMAYFIAGVSAFLSSLCYSEYAVEFPVAGGSFTFILYTFGEFWAWITATNLIFNYGEAGTHVSPLTNLAAGPRSLLQMQSRTFAYSMELAGSQLVVKLCRALRMRV